MSRKAVPGSRKSRRSYADEFKRAAMQLLFDGHSAVSICERLRWGSPNRLYRWNREYIELGGPGATSLEARVQELEGEFQRLQREGDIPTRAMAIFSCHG